MSDRPTYVLLPSGTVVRLSGVLLARRMRPEELRPGSTSGFLLVYADDVTIAIEKDERDVGALDAFFRAAAKEVAPDV